MTQEHKELLLKDLCARLPYGVKIELTWWVMGEGTYINTTIEPDHIEQLLNDKDGNIEIKPYLFPLSSMTEEQKQEYTYIVNYISSDDTENWKEGEFIYVEQFTKLMRFYYMNHLDYMGLIPLGLAKDASGLDIYE